MPNWKLTLTYDGTAYHGWQIQPRGLKTIQGELQAALYRILGENPLPQGSGRTDAGVHALGQVASFELTAPIPPENLHRALNRTLPASIRVLQVEPATAAFHARHSAIAKTYEYRIFRGGLCSPFLAPFVYHSLWKLDLPLLERAAEQVIGEHDFVSLAAADPDFATRGEQAKGEAMGLYKSTVRRIFSSSWSERAFESTDCCPGTLLVYRVRGNGFLHHMIRNLVGTMLEIARGQFPADAMPDVLEAKSRSAAGPTAPAKGLFLHSVEYPVGDTSDTNENTYGDSTGLLLT